MKTFETVGNITVDYVNSSYSMKDILENLADTTDDLIEKAIYISMDADKIRIDNNSQGYYENKYSDHSVTKINNLAELVPLMIKDNDIMQAIWNNGIDKEGEKLTSPYIGDMSNCFDNDLLWNHIEAYIDKVADGLIDNVIKEVESIDESDYQDAHNHLAFEEFKRVNNIESDNNFYEFDYINGTTVLDGYTQITHDQYEELYVKLPELVEHKRETIDDGELVKTEILYSFLSI